MTLNPSPLGRPDETHRTSTTIEPMAITRLRPHPRNARTHSKKQIRQIADSIQKFGFTNPILISDDDEIIAGHGRVAAAKLLGMSSVPTLRLAHLNEAQRRAYVIADNKLALKAGWDREILAVELQALIDLDFDVEITGFTIPEIEVLIDGTREPVPARTQCKSNADERPHTRDADETQHEPNPDDARLPLQPVAAAVTKRGDLWLAGEHRLLCGDPRSADTFGRLMAGECADVVFTDPPHCASIAGHAGALARTRNREFDLGVGEISRGALPGIPADDAWPHGGSLPRRRNRIRRRQLAPPEPRSLRSAQRWAPNSGTSASGTRSRQSRGNGIAASMSWSACSRSAAPHAPRHARSAKTHAAGATCGIMHRPLRRRTYNGQEVAELGSVKPVALVADALGDCSRPGAIVLDPIRWVGHNTDCRGAHQPAGPPHRVRPRPLRPDFAPLRARHRPRCHPGGERPNLPNRGRGACPGHPQRAGGSPMNNRQKMHPPPPTRSATASRPRTPVSARGSLAIPAADRRGTTARSADALLLEELNRLLPVRQGGKVQRLPALQVIYSVAGPTCRPRQRSRGAPRGPAPASVGAPKGGGGPGDWRASYRALQVRPRAAHCALTLRSRSEGCPRMPETLAEEQRRTEASPVNVQASGAEDGAAASGIAEPGETSRPQPESREIPGSTRLHDPSPNGA